MGVTAAATTISNKMLIKKILYYNCRAAEPLW